MKLIQMLLRNPCQSIRAEVLVGREVEVSSSAVENLSADGAGLPRGRKRSVASSPPDDDAMFDYRTDREAKSRLKQIEIEGRDALEMGQTERASALEEEARQINDYFGKHCDRRNRPRRMGDVTETARKAASGRCTRALDSIRVAFPALYLHLSDSIKKGRTCTYRPPAETDWLT